jgi:hypothetical protein
MKRLFILLAFLHPALALSGDAELSWTAPTQNEDGTPLTDLAGFKIYWGTTQGGPYPTSVDIPDPAQTTHTVTGLADGTWYFVATAYNIGGTESQYSGEASKVLATPQPPVLVVIETTAYSVAKTENKFLLAAVGTVPLGVECIEDEYVNGYHAVPWTEVDSWFGSVRSELVVAKCASQ